MNEQIQGVVLDWAGTAVDYGCMAPVQVFVDIFRSAGIDPELDEVRKPMGMLKWDHIRTMLNMPRIAGLFMDKYGRPHTDEDVDRMHDAFEPLLLDILPRYAEPLPHVLETVGIIRSAGIRIGSTTGYNDNMMRIVADRARNSGYEPDFWISPDGTNGKGRPYPYMIYTNMMKLDMGMPWQVVKVGDTESDMQEGRNAGVWTVGVLKGSSMMGLSERETASLPEEELRRGFDRARDAYAAGGAHYVIGDMSGLPDVIERINERLAKGEKPHDISSLA